MSESGRKYTHTDTRPTGGPDLPHWMRHNPIRGTINALPAAIVLWGIIIAACWQLWNHMPPGWLS